MNVKYLIIYFILWGMGLFMIISGGVPWGTPAFVGYVMVDNVACAFLLLFYCVVLEDE